jgi:hypothetical protein
LQKKQHRNAQTRKTLIGHRLVVLLLLGTLDLGGTTKLLLLVLALLACISKVSSVLVVGCIEDIGNVRCWREGFSTLVANP